ncbi:MAG: 3-phosphoglycerate dehydrogenase [Bacteroidetes bacterium HGW-Bacteroidetes-21]|jgi:D-3-phosphoglycerate dehydrogenase|nr:MAG: 3-phosphoglycerate dehydrogenase [Bacteroidetes bacterium HGW-Bacteroidetes-21]
MINILINDGLCPEGENILHNAGFHIHNQKIDQADLIQEINHRKIDAIIVRSATVVDKNVIESCPTLKLIGRAGLGMNNIDMAYAQTKGIEIINTPMASAPALAEMVIAHLLSVTRNLYIGNRQFPSEREIGSMKKSCAGGTEITGKTMGIIGFGHVGQEVAKRALGLGVNVIAYDPYVKEAHIRIDIPNVHNAVVYIHTVPLNEVLASSDFITLHIPVPADGKPFISRKEIEIMKTGVILINVSKAGLIDEQELISALNQEKIKAAGLDVFNNEPAPLPALITHPKISVSPHIAGETIEAQNHIGVELAGQIVQFFKS